MSTLLLTQPEGKEHQTPEGHPERPDRIHAVRAILDEDLFSALRRELAPAADLDLVELAHDGAVLRRLQDCRPTAGISQIDPDTYLSPGSIDVAATGLGAGLRALEAVMGGEADNAFCAVRPPGHHAERNRSMGFCLFNSIAILARVAQKRHGVERVAIVDFDVHHGNGTQDIFWSDPSVFYGSSHQMPLYPGTGAPNEMGAGNISNVALAPGSGGMEMRLAYEQVILPALEAFRPEVLLISAGFDAHHRDPLAGLEWTGEDFAWVTGRLLDFAGKRCDNRVVSMLEGGYDLEGLAEGVAQHVSMLAFGRAIDTDQPPADEENGTP